MEDISRELEKEIAQSRPKPYKKNRMSRVLIIDDFGKMKSGDYLKLLVKGLCTVCLVCFILAVVFYKLYTDASRDADAAQSGLTRLQQRVEDLSGEKEVLMARLVMLGKEPVLTAQAEPPKLKEKTKPAAPALKQKPETVKSDPIPPEPDIKKNNTPAVLSAKKEEPVSPVAGTDGEQQDKEADSAIPPADNKMVAVEKFTVTKDGDNGDLLVRFDIRNVSNAPGDVSGRIFTVLKPEARTPDQWLVVPSTSLKGGIPSEYRKGQYFSIAHFKPVKFRIKNSAGPDFFKTAAIYIFNNQGELIYQKLIEITEAEQSG